MKRALSISTFTVLAIATLSSCGQPTYDSLPKGVGSAYFPTAQSLENTVLNDTQNPSMRETSELLLGDWFPTQVAKDYRPTEDDRTCVRRTEEAAVGAFASEQARHLSKQTKLILEEDGRFTYETVFYQDTNCEQPTNTQTLLGNYSVKDMAQDMSPDILGGGTLKMVFLTFQVTLHSRELIEIYNTGTHELSCDYKDWKVGQTVDVTRCNVQRLKQFDRTTSFVLSNDTLLLTQDANRIKLSMPVDPLATFERIRK